VSGKGYSVTPLSKQEKPKIERGRKVHYTEKKGEKDKKGGGGGKRKKKGGVIQSKQKPSGKVIR